MKRTGLMWMLSLVLAATMCINTYAQDGRNHGHHGKRGKSNHHTSDKSHYGNLSQKVYRVTQADSVQKLKMKPTLDKTSKRLAALRLNYEKQQKRVLDSLSLQVKPYLKEDQVKRLNDWKDKSGRK
jgi:hypothetical protein